MPPAANALLILLAGLSGLLLLGAGSAWFKIIRDRKGEGETVSIERLHYAATLTGVAFILLGVSLVLLAVISVPWSD